MTPDAATPALALVFPPAFVLIAAGIAIAFLRGALRDIVFLAAPLIALALVWLLPEGSHFSFDWLGLRIEPLRVDALARLFAIVFCVMAFAGGLFALRQERWAELAAAYVYAGAALGAVFAGDLITLFFFWEVMALGSTTIIWSAGGDRARAAGFRYIAMHLFGGVLLMAGIAGHVGATGSVAFSAMQADSPAHWLILAGFLINAGAPPLSAWLPDAYPEASWSGMVFLSAFTTKTAVYVLLRGFPGEDILIWIGLFMVFYGIVYAILENDMRRILAYSIVNQVGFMVTGIGIGTGMALNGAAAHAFVHILYKALLLMSAGSVLYMTGKRKCTDLGGLFRTMPLTTIAGIVGALSISAFPLTSGFIAKPMISEGAVERAMPLVWFLLAAASAGVFSHAGIKFPWFVFFQKDSGLRPADPPWPMRAAMILLSALCIGIGIWPEPLYAILPFPTDFEPYTGGHVVGQLQLLLFAGLAFFVLLDWLKRTETITLDTDWLWRRPARALARDLTARSASARSGLIARGQRMAERTTRTLYRHHGPAGWLARAWPTGSMAFWATLLLVGWLILYYV
jgi:multicomponent Na+:H+ antiporter subunit D